MGGVYSPCNSNGKSKAQQDKYLDERGLDARRGEKEKGEQPSGHSHHCTREPGDTLVSSERFLTHCTHRFSVVRQINLTKERFWLQVRKTLSQKTISQDWGLLLREVVVSGSWQILRNSGDTCAWKDYS